MSTIAQIKQLVAPLLARHPDLVLNGRYVHLTPVHHLARGIVIDRTSDKRGFRPVWTVNFLFEPQDNLYMTYGFGLYPAGNDGWDIDRPGVDAELLAQIEEKALPRLREIKTIDDFHHFATTAPFFGNTMLVKPRNHVYVAAARGDFETAEMLCRQLDVPPPWHDDNPRFAEGTRRIVKELGPPVAARDRAAVATLLREWEAYTAKKLKLEKYWQPTPFPFET